MTTHTQPLPHRLRHSGLESAQSRGTGLVQSVVLAVLGGALTFASFAIWLVTGPEIDPLLALMKGGTSLVMFVAALICIVCARKR